MKHVWTRRSVLKLGAATGLSYALRSTSRATETTPPASPSHADLILLNGRIATQDERRSFATAVAIKDSRFVTVGSEQEVMVHKGDHTQVIDVGGRTVAAPARGP